MMHRERQCLLINVVGPSLSARLPLATSILRAVQYLAVLKAFTPAILQGSRRSQGLRFNMKVRKEDSYSRTHLEGLARGRRDNSQAPRVQSTAPLLVNL